ncbi:MAG: response regulator [Limnothrix sp.]
MKAVKIYKVLIVEDSSADFELYREYLRTDEAYQYELVHVDVGIDGLDYIINQTPDFILVDFSLPDMDGIQFIEAVRKINIFPNIPIIMLTGQGNEAIALQAMKNHIEDYLVKRDLNRKKFLNAIYRLITIYENNKIDLTARTINILLVDDSLQDLALYERFLHKDPDSAFNVCTANSAKEALQIFQNRQFDLAVVDNGLPDEDGLKLSVKFKDFAMTDQFPVVMVTGSGNEQLVVDALKNGISDYLVKQFVTPDSFRKTIKDALYKSNILSQLNKTQFQKNLLSKISLNIRQSLELNSILETAVIEVQKFLQANRVLIYKIDGENSSIAAEVIEGPFLKVRGLERSDTFFEEEQNQKPYIYDNRKQIISNIQAENVDDSYRELLERLQVKSIISIPIILENLADPLWGILTIHFCDRYHHWESSEVAFLQELSLQIGVGIQQGLLVEELKKERDRANAATESKSVFLANMSHEIRTPMNGILGMAEILALSNLSDQAKDYVNIIQSSGNNLLNLINDILDLSKLESGNITLKSEGFFIETLVKETAHFFQAALGKKDLKFSWEIEADLAKKYTGDPDRIKQILINLIGNAIKFTNKGEINCKLQSEPPYESYRVSQLSAGQCSLYFTIQDTGMGISCADQEKLFKPFSQVDNSTTKAVQGTGLGLSICKNLVEMMGGEIGIDSKEGVGSTFWFSIVLECSEAGNQDGESCEIDGNVNGYSPIEGLKILVVEDNLINQTVAIHQLERLGYVCDIANNGQEALEVLEKSDYDLVLMDCQMPILDGYETAKKIRRNKSTKDLVIVGLTAYAMKGDRDKCLAAGMNDYLTKPYSIAEIQSIFDIWLTDTSSNV